MLDLLQYYFQVLCNGMKMRFRMVMIAHPGPGIGFHKRFMWRIIIPPTVHALQRLKANKIADFLFDVMCRFGCVFQLTRDNGTEFKGMTEELMRKYKVPVVHISPYNSQANGKIKRTQRTYLDAIWKVLQGDTCQWPSWLGYALWADRTMVKRNMGYSPYYLLYGQHPLHPFDMMNMTYHMRDWVKVTNMKELLALRMQQLAQRKDLLNDMEKRNY